MKKAPLFTVILVLFGILFSNSCKSPSEPEASEPVVMSGQVLDNATRNPLRNVIIQLVDPKPEQYTSTDSLGRYSFNVRIDSLTQVTIVFAREGYDNVLRSFLAIPGNDITVSDVLMNRADGEGPPIDDDESGSGAALALVNISNTVIDVKESGGIEQSVLTFVVRDSLGNPVTITNRTQVNFSLGASPNGGETLFPTSAMTNALG